MAYTNRERIGRALDLLQEGLTPFIEQEMRGYFGDDIWEQRFPVSALSNGTYGGDVQAQVNTIIDLWDDVFEPVPMPKKARDLCFEIRKVRNQHAHQQPFNSDETTRALIDIQKMLELIEAAQADAVQRLKNDHLRSALDVPSSREKKRQQNMPLEGLVLEGLKPWQSVVAPHRDVREGSYQQAEFAADLWQVYENTGSPEYCDPYEFFRRTYVTDGLGELLAKANQRLRGNGGDPVVELQVTFGGGKTHSMIALYHLFGGAITANLAGAEGLELGQVPTVRRAVVVGTVLRPGSPIRHEDGIVANTLWGEIAWQLGGKEGYEIVREADESATNPGNLLDKLFESVGPSLVLIDEWVAYARQLFNRDKSLKGGDFDTQFTFAQTLCEAARRSKNVLVAISIPASERSDGTVIGSHVGTTAGVEATSRLKDAVGRQNLVWRPATSDESFEIVRRRLFEPITSREDLDARDAVVSAFSNMYHAAKHEFPSDCVTAEYENKLRRAYPIHPELFERLYKDWSVLEKFQRTRGVLKLMAEVIHALWRGAEKAPLILPSSVPLSDKRVQPILTNFLDQRWPPIIDSDVDGRESVPVQLDNESKNFNEVSAGRRVARAIFIATAPREGGKSIGLDDKRIKLACTQPGEPTSRFGDALRRLADRCAHLYTNQGAYWYSTQPNVNSLAKERLTRIDRSDLQAEAEKRLIAAAKGSTAGFPYVVAAPRQGDVADRMELQLVLLPPTLSHHRGKTVSPATTAALDILRDHGPSHRKFRNALVFCACDDSLLPNLNEALLQFLAWKSIEVDSSRDLLNLDDFNKAQVRDRCGEWDKTCGDRLLEAYRFALAPRPPSGSELADFEELSLQGNDGSIASRAWRKLKSAGLVADVLGGAILRAEIDQADRPLWDGDHVSVKRVQECFATYFYYPRVTAPKVIEEAIRQATSGGILWEHDGLAHADAVKEDGSYVGLFGDAAADASRRFSGYVVKPSAYLRALEQIDDVPNVVPPDSGNGSGSGGIGPVGPDVPRTTVFTRYHGSKQLDPLKAATEFQKTFESLVRHLIENPETQVSLTLEVSAEAINGFPAELRRLIGTNGNELGVSGQFDEE